MKCLCGCGRRAKSRGLCCAAYMAASRAVHRGRTTWAKLEAQGKVLKRYQQYESTTRISAYLLELPAPVEFDHQEAS